jgi:taurine dioxygenase
VHPAVLTRSSGEKVLHLSPWMAVGIEGHEDPEGDELLEALCQEMLANVRPYQHRWASTDVLVWDNRRMLHSEDGCDPRHRYRMQRVNVCIE